MKILDIGCSLGFFLLEAQKRGLETYGVEISELSAEYAQKQFGLNVFTGTLEAAHFLDKSFDIITLWDVIEHIPEPICLLTEVKRVLKDDGVLALQSPNMDSMMASLTKEQWNWWTVPDHLFHFTPLSMSRLIESNGFDILKSYTWEPPNDLVLNLLIAGLCLRFPSNNIIIRIIGKVITVFSNWVGPVITPIQKINWRRQKGGLIVVYAQKNKCEPR